jgi:host factor-I protein
MDTVTHNDEGGLNIQNDYFNNARKNRTRITIFLTNGQRITGLIRSFDKFTVIMETRTGDQMLFKHAITSVATALPNDRESRGPRPPFRQGERPHGDARRSFQGGSASGRPGAPSGPGGPGGGAGAPGAAGQAGSGGPGAAPSASRDGGSGRPDGDTRQRGAASPQGKQFGNFMDLSALAQPPAQESSADQPQEQPASQAQSTPQSETDKGSAKGADGTDTPQT